LRDEKLFLSFDLFLAGFLDVYQPLTLQYQSRQRVAASLDSFLVEQVLFSLSLLQDVARLLENKLLPSPSRSL